MDPSVFSSVYLKAYISTHGNARFSSLLYFQSNSVILNVELTCFFFIILKSLHVDICGTCVYFRRLLLDAMPCQWPAFNCLSFVLSCFVLYCSFVLSSISLKVWEYLFSQDYVQFHQDFLPSFLPALTKLYIHSLTNICRMLAVCRLLF